MFGGGGAKLEETIFELRFCAKQLDRLSKRAEKEQRQETTKVKKALEKGDQERARIYAENAIRKKNESLNYLRMSSKVDAVSSKIKSAASVKAVTQNIGQVTKALQKAMNSMDLQKVSAVMDKFETQFENLDVGVSTLESAMGQATTLSTPEDQVTDLIKQVADEAGLDIMSQLANAPMATPASTVVEREKRKEADDHLESRLAQLRGGF